MNEDDEFKDLERRLNLEGFKATPDSQKMKPMTEGEILVALKNGLTESQNARLLNVRVMDIVAIVRIVEATHERQRVTRKIGVTQEPKVQMMPSETRYSVHVEGHGTTYWDNIHDAITHAQRSVYSGPTNTTRALDDLNAGRIAEWSYGFSAVRIYPPQNTPTPQRKRHVSQVCPQCHWTTEEAPQRQPLTDEMVVAAGRMLSDRQAAACNVDCGDMWNLHGNDFIDDARVALEAALGIGEK
jgi:hypothetical protein